ncbi:MAG: membrane integrity-associated transporter subunit PqiC [Dechloromonas sp.]|nr:membrane integrity-associated transporter subunit PqiC [Dechloromonas sp.]
MRMLLALLACLLMAACITNGKRGADAAPAVYDLGPAPAPAPASAGRPALALDVRAPGWLDGEGIAYRLAYAEPARRNDYSRARWAAPPASLVRQRLGEGLGLAALGQARVRCVMRVELDEFAQVFSGPREARGELRARLQILDRGRALLAEEAFAIAKASPSPDAAGGVAALTGAVDELASRAGVWRANLVASGRLKACEE